MSEYLLTDEQWKEIEPCIPMGRRGPKPDRNREVLTGIVYVLTTGCSWTECPAAYGPPTTIHSRFRRWSADGIFSGILLRLVLMGVVPPECMDGKSGEARRYRFAKKRRRRGELRLDGLAGVPAPRAGVFMAMDAMTALQPVAGLLG